jgi:hypothetical protein
MLAGAKGLSQFFTISKPGTVPRGGILIIELPFSWHIALSFQSSNTQLPFSSFSSSFNQSPTIHFIPEQKGIEILRVWGV